MPQISVLIAGKTYRMACGEGEEERLETLAGMLDAKIGEMREAFGEIGDMRLQVMAALTFADMLVDSRTRLAALETEVGELESLLADADERRLAVVAGDERRQGMRGQQAGEQTGRRAAVAEIEHRLGLGQPADPDAEHAPAVSAAAALDMGAQRAHGRRRAQHVLALEQAVDDGLADRHGAEHDRPVGD